jgi:hypothetical protein
MSSYMYLCMYLCMCMCECKSEVKKTQDNVVVVVKWSEVKKRVWEKDKTKSTTLLSFQLNTLPLLPNSLTHLLKQTDRQRKKDLYCFATKTKTFVLLFNKHSSFFLPNTAPFLFNKHISIASQSLPLLSLLNSMQLNSSTCIPFQQRLMFCQTEMQIEIEMQSHRVLFFSNKQTERQRDNQTKVRGRCRGEGRNSVERQSGTQTLSTLRRRRRGLVDFVLFHT